MKTIGPMRALQKLSRSPHVLRQNLPPSHEKPA